MFFTPTDEWSRPLAFIQDLFNMRAEIVAKNKLDVRGQVIKLAINSVYGKFAQRVGQFGSRRLLVVYGMRQRLQPERAVNSWKPR